MKKTPTELTPLELEVMRILWETGPATVQEVHRRIQGSRKLAYNTVQTMLTILHRKGKVKRTAEKRAYLYSPTVSHERTAANAIKNLVDRLFGGRAEALVLNLVRSRQLDAAKLADLQTLLQEEEDSHDGKR